MLPQPPALCGGFMTGRTTAPAELRAQIGMASGNRNPARFNSSRRYALGLEHARCLRRLEIVEEGLRRGSVLAVGGNPADEDQLVLQVAGEGAGQFDAGRKQHIGEKNAELGRATRTRLR